MNINSIKGQAYLLNAVELIKPKQKIQGCSVL